MKTQVRKNERVLNLLAYLLRARRTIPYEEIRRNVDGYNDADTAETAVARRFERDKKTLRELGVNLLWSDDPVTGVQGYLVPRQGAYMGDVELSQREMRLLTVLAAVSRDREGPLMANLASACQKLLAHNPLFEPDTAALAHHLVYPAKTATDAALSSNVAHLALAVECRRRVEFTYYSIHRDATSSREVEPYGLKFFQGEWYLVGRCLDARDIRIFRLDRIKGAAKSKRTSGEGQYDIPAGFSVSDYIGRSPWQLSTGSTVTVRVSLDDVGAWIVEETSPSGLSLKRRKDSATATVEVSNEEAFFRWLLQLGVHARIDSPRTTADAFVEFVKGLRQACQT